MRISDWSSDVCSSDLTNVHGHRIVGANHRELVEGNYIYGFSHYPAHTLSLPTRTFTISLLRDPVSRIISHYNMTLDYVSRGIKRPWVAVERPWLGRSILEFCDNMPKSRLYAQLWKFSSDFSPEEAHQTISRCDFILFNDTYSLDLQEISRRLGFSLVMRRVHRGRRRVDITDSEKRQLLCIIGPEIEFVSKVKIGRPH